MIGRNEPDKDFGEVSGKAASAVVEEEEEESGETGGLSLFTGVNDEELLKEFHEDRTDDSDGSGGFRSGEGD